MTMTCCTLAGLAPGTHTNALPLMFCASLAQEKECLIELSLQAVKDGHTGPVSGTAAGLAHGAALGGPVQTQAGSEWHEMENHNRPLNCL